MDLSENAPVSTSKNIGFQFDGTAGEYFRIWIVNTLLTIITLGIYSAWAKVRTRKYLYQHTTLDGSSFDYHADPIKILKGRAIMAALGILYFFGGRISPTVTYVAMLIFGLLLPWIVVRGNIFNFSNTSYRNIRFGFMNNVKGAYSTYIKGYLIVIFTLGIGWYYMIYLHTKFKLNSTRFGKSYIKYQADASPIFGILVRGGLLYLPAVLIGSTLSYLFKDLLGPDIAGIVAVVFVYIGIAAGAAYVRGTLLNYNLCRTSLNEIKIRCKVDWVYFGWLYTSNLVAIALTLGLAIPWAMVRVHEYKLSRIYLKVSSDNTLDQFTMSDAESAGVLSDAAVDLWDIDIGF